MFKKPEAYHCLEDARGLFSERRGAGQTGTASVIQLPIWPSFLAFREKGPYGQ